MPGIFIDQLLLIWRHPSRRVMARWPEATRLLEFPNARLRVRDVGSGSRTIVLTPDSPVMLENYDRLIALLAPHARVICFEFPGCGFSYPRFGFRFALADYVGILGDVMDALHIERATLAFTCVNAFVAMAYARTHPDRVERLMLAQVAGAAQMRAFGERIDLNLGGLHVLHTPVLGQLFMMAARKPIAHRWFRSALPKGFDIGPIWDQVHRVLTDGGAFCLASLIQGQSMIAADELNVTGVPTHVVWGDADRTHRKTDKNSIVSHLPHAKIHHLEVCGHCPDIEAPELYSRLLLEG